MKKTKQKEDIKKLEMELGFLQREARNKNIPIFIIFEGLDAAGKGTLINEVLLTLDPRGYKVFSNIKYTEEEKYRPFFWKFWNNFPSGGEIGIFDRSWYYSLVRNNLREKDKALYKTRCREIVKTEELLQNSGALIIKFFLKISKDIQKERLKELERNPSTSWKVTKKDWKNHLEHAIILDSYQHLIKKTDTNSNWNIINSEDFKDAKLKIFKILTKKISERVSSRPKQIKCELEEIQNRFSLDSIDLSKIIEKSKYDKKLKKYQERLRELEHELYTHRIPLILAYEGWDAAGKGGNIRRVVGNLDPRGYDVIPIAAPNDIEKKHHYLWRFWTKFPKGGHIAVFDRTWYGRVLVERVEGFCSENEWKRSYEEIVDMEKQWTDDNAILLKFWIHIDKDEQLRRFESRQQLEHKKWKITDEDWRNREKWDTYKEAIEDMITLTHKKSAPWHVISGNSKLYARLQVLEIIIDAIEKKLRKI